MTKKKTKKVLRERDEESRPLQKKRKRKQLLEQDLDSLPPEQGKPFCGRESKYDS